MLRVTTKDEAEMIRLKIEGRLAGADVDNVEVHWHSIASARQQFPILIDLTGVTFVDEAGKKLLAEMNRHGDKFLTCGLLTKAIIEEVSREG
jgi:anti-anti-sigma regulatory factor